MDFISIFASAYIIVVIFKPRFIEMLFPITFCEKRKNEMYTRNFIN